MLQSILKLHGVKELKKEIQKNIAGGVSSNGICPRAGDSCCAGGFLDIPCLGPIAPIKCINGVWTEI